MLLPGLILIAGLIAFGVIAQRGCLRPDALTAGPSRRVGLHPADLLIGFGLMIVGQAMLPLLLPGTFAPPTGTGQPADADTMTMALRVLIAQGIGQGAPVLYLLWRAGFAPKGVRKIGLIPTKPGRDLLWGVLAFFAAVPMVLAVIQLTTLIGWLFGHEPPALAHDMLKMLVESDSIAGTALIVVSAVLVAPILEESIFRGLIQSVMVEALGESRRWAVVGVASFVFALIHGFEHWQALPGLFVLGMVLGWLYERSGSLWPGIALHMAFNGLNILLAILLQGHSS